ncbi:hypothetical protein ACFWF7_42170 [Nocardia sp. NPDC060256]|uniref:hypothetical protein n=1 Tax=unclassified Nocardia TaxID=2637762 RepID=UPI00366185FE
MTQQRWVRPLVGVVAALAMVAGGLVLFSYNVEPGPPPAHDFNTAPVIKPMPTNHWPGQGN